MWEFPKARDTLILGSLWLLLGPPIFANPHVECSGISQIIVDHALDAELSLTDPTCQGTSCLHGPLQLVKAI